jgi:hypothetical protein
MNPDINTLRQSIDVFWDAEILPALTKYIKIPNKSVHFDPDWERHGHMRTPGGWPSTGCGRIRCRAR